jgi:hypothetical protein
MLILPEFLISGLRLFQSRVVEGKKDFLVISYCWNMHVNFGMVVVNKTDNLEKLQLKAGRIVSGWPLFASRQSIYSETDSELLYLIILTICV